MKIIKTKYDGFYLVKEKNKISMYEGYALCPRKVQDEIDKNNYKEINYFALEAVQFGKI